MDIHLTSERHPFPQLSALNAFMVGHTLMPAPFQGLCRAARGSTHARVESRSHRLWNAAMNRSTLVAKLASRFPALTAQDADVSVKTILAAMTEALAKGERIEIRDFGSFSLSYRPARTGRNPRTGATVEVPAKYAPHFKAGKELRDRVAGQPPAVERPMEVLAEVE